MRTLLRLLASGLDPATRNWLVVVAGSGARLALGFVASVAIARSLGPAAFGVFALLGAVANVAGAGADLGLTDAAVKRIASVWPDHPAQARERSQVFFWLRTGAVVPVVAGGSLLAGLLAREGLVRPATAALLPLALLGVAATALSGAVSALLQATGRFGRLAVVALMNAGLTVILAIALTLAGQLTLVTALVVLGIGTSLASFAVGRRLLPDRWRLHVPARAALASEGRPLLRFGRWLWVANVFAMLTAQFDVLLVAHWSDSATVGAYALALNLATKADVVNSSLYTVLLPAASSLNGAGAVRRYARQSLLRSTLIGLALLPAMPLSGFLIPFCYGPAYAPAITLFRGLLGVVIFDAFTTPLLLLSYHFNRPKLLAAAEVLRAGMLLLAGAALIPATGAPGAIVAKLAAKLAGAGLTLAALTRRGD